MTDINTLICELRRHADRDIQPMLPRLDAREIADALSEQRAEIARLKVDSDNLDAIAWRIEPHYKGAGLKAEYAWIVARYNQIASEADRADELEEERDALRARVAELTNPPCNVCLGEQLPSGRACICGGAGTQAEELVGLRKAVVAGDDRYAALLQHARAMADVYDHYVNTADHEGVEAAVAAFRAWEAKQ